MPKLLALLFYTARRIDPVIVIHTGIVSQSAAWERMRSAHTLNLWWRAYERGECSTPCVCGSPPSPTVSRPSRADTAPSRQHRVGPAGPAFGSRDGLDHHQDMA